jgi:prevent-host-death family protein
MTHMERVGIREMRQNLSRYARRVREGESFIVTERGAEVALLVPAPGLATPLDRLVATRGARRGHGDLLEILDELPTPIAGPPTSDVLDASRAERA